MVTMYKNHDLLHFVTASKLPEEVKERKDNMQLFKRDALELNWSYSCFREAYSDRNSLFAGEGEGQTKVSCTVTLTQKK